jgi:hypothetical protein
MTLAPLSRQLVRMLVVWTAAATTIVSAGCSTLNEWKGPNEDPFFSVLDEPKVTTPTGPKTFAGAKAPSGNAEPADQVRHACGTMAGSE